MLRYCAKIITSLLLLSVPSLAGAAIKGDVNNNGSIDYDDVWSLKDYVLSNWTKYQPEYDYNGDGRVSVSDVCQVLYKVHHPGGIDVGIGGWEEDDEDLGGVVSAPVRPGAAPKLTFSIPGLTVRPGQEFCLETMMTNSVNVYGMQFAVTVPQGIEYVDDGRPCRYDLLRDFDWPRVCEWGRSDQTLFCMHFSQELQPFPGDNGATMRMYLRVPEDTPAGEYRVHISSVDLVDSKFSGIAVDDFDVTINVVDFIPGDVNDDGIVSVLDIVLVVDYILSRTPQKFNFAAADVSGDGSISVVDITTIVAMILNQ